MAWIESHQALATHRKVYQLAQALNISRAEAIGHLHLLWWWALDNAPDGDLTDVSDEVLASVSGFLDGVSHRFGKRFDVVCSNVRAILTNCGWIDDLPNGERKLHDWEDYAGKLIQAREADRQRHRKSREAPGKLQGGSAEAPGKLLATVPNRTQPYPTLPSPPLVPSPAREGTDTSSSPGKELPLDDRVRRLIAVVESFSEGHGCAPNVAQHFDIWLKEYSEAQIAVGIAQAAKQGWDKLLTPNYIEKCIASTITGGQDGRVYTARRVSEPGRRDEEQLSEGERLDRAWADPQADIDCGRMRKV